MGSKINIQQLAKTLAEKKNISQTAAETFLREFFDAIIQNVTTDKVVKIKGLGTFKLIEVQDRESINVHTGERIVIPGHPKLSFTPDASLKDTVNKPFADFQTVVINEGTDLEEMERTPQPTLGEDVEIEEEGQEEQDTPVQQSQDEEEKEPETEKGKEPEPDPDPDPVLVPGIDTKDSAEPPAQPKFAALTTAEKYALTLGAILLFLFGYFLGYQRVFTPHKQSKLFKETEYLESPRIDDVPETELVQEDSLSQDKPLAPEAKPVAQNPKPQVAKPLKLDPGKKYQITGTRKTHTMKPGDYLAKIAFEEYGDKEFARYIINHNRFPNPDNIPVGKEINLPELKEIE